MSSDTLVIPEECEDIYIIRSITSSFTITFHVVAPMPNVRSLFRFINPSPEECQAFRDLLKDWTETPLPPEAAEINLWGGVVRYTR